VGGQEPKKELSFPKEKIKILLLEGISETAEERFKADGFPVDRIDSALKEEELIEIIGDYFVIGIRSRTQITKRVLDKARRLLVIGAFCIGTNQIDLEYAAKKGIPVFNAPYSNTRSVAELIIGEIIMLARGIFEKSVYAHKGEWLKTAKNSYEVRGKTIGIIGYGRIGSQVSILAECLGMRVIYYDIADKLPLGNAKPVSLEELLRTADVITLHVPSTPLTKNMISEKEFAMMKDGVLFLNASRGDVVDLKALKKYLESKKVRAAAIDVFPKEPKNKNERFECELQGMYNVILTPHIGGSTTEAQRNIGVEVSQKILKFINIGSTATAVNFPEVELPVSENTHRLLHIHKNIPGVLNKVNGVLAEFNINVESQYLQTKNDIGYLVLDTEKKLTKEVIDRIKQKCKETIKVRVLY
jgi:D-3-phosphoglycerate dehydrogenase